MLWDYPKILLLLWVLPLTLFMMLWANRRNNRRAQRFATPQMLRHLMPAGSVWRQVIRGTALIAGVTCLLIGAARPRWGVYYEDVQTRGLDMFILLDVSRSMLAEDVAPNRLDRAKSDIRDLLTRLRGDRVGLIVFAGAVIVQVPLTSDQAYFQFVLSEVDTDSAPRGGSLLGDAVRKALDALEEQHDRDRVLVVITDGEDHDSFPLEAAKEAAARDVKIFTVGLGDTREGQRIPVRDDSGNLTYLKHDGQEVWSRMDEGLLREIALSTGGAYIPARTTAYDLGEIYDLHLAKLTRGDIQTERQQRYRDRFQWFIAAGFVLLLLEMLIPRYAQPKVFQSVTKSVDA